MRTALAVVLVLVALIGLFIMTRGLPKPPPPAGPCTQNTDCPAPQVCVSGVCTDPALPGLIGSAQAAARALYGTLQGLSAAFAGSYYPHAQALQAAAVAMGLTSPPLGGLQADLAAGQGDLTKYLNYLAVPRCDPSRSVSCGYYAQVMG